MPPRFCTIIISYFVTDGYVIGNEIQVLFAAH